MSPMPLRWRTQSRRCPRFRCSCLALHGAGGRSALPQDRIRLDMGLVRYETDRFVRKVPPKMAEVSSFCHQLAGAKNSASTRSAEFKLSEAMNAQISNRSFSAAAESRYC